MHLQLRQNPKALLWKWRQNWTFNIKIPTLNAPISTNKVFIFKLTIEDNLKNYFGLIRSKFLSLSLIKSVAFFLEHPVNTTSKLEKGTAKQGKVQSKQNRNIKQVVRRKERDWQFDTKPKPSYGSNPFIS